MNSILFSIIFGFFSNQSIQNKAFIMSFKETSTLPVFNQVESSIGLLIAKKPINFVYKHYFDDYEETIISNGEKVKIVSKPNNPYDEKMIIYKNQNELFSKKDLNNLFKTYESVFIKKTNMINYIKVNVKLLVNKNDYIKEIEIQYFEPSMKIKYIKYLTKSGVKVILNPSFQARVSLESNFFVF